MRILALLALLLLTACARSHPDTITAAPETITIGAILPLTGTAASYGISAQKGIELAREEASHQNVKNLTFQVYYEDSQFTARGGVDAYTYLSTTQRMDAIITHGSAPSMAVLPLATKDGILQMAIAASVDAYTTPGDLSFRTSARTGPEIRVATAFMREKGFRRVAVIYMDNDIGISIRDSLRKSLNGSPAIVAEGAYPLDETDFRSLLAKAREQNPDVIFLVGTAKHYALLLKQADELGIRAQFMSFRTAEDPVLLNNTARYAEGLIYTYSFDPATLEAEHFSAAYRAKYGTLPDAYAAEGYEGFRLTAAAFAHCGRNETCAGAYLSQLHDYPSVFGPLSFDKNGDVVYPFFLKQVRNGTFVRYTG
jgi:branched-chain amino acid transport system substrate-binding protein